MAEVAGVGLTWYTWLEQGRNINPSGEILRRIAQALRLDEADEAHLFLLADVPHSPRSVLPGNVPPAVNCVLAAFQGPAVVLDPMFNLVAWNSLAAQLYNFDDSAQPYPENQLWQFFMNPSRRALYQDYDTVAPGFVALFRSIAIDFNQPQYQSLIEDLVAASSHFDMLWTTRATTPLAAQTVRLIHPGFGHMETYSVRSILPSMGKSFLLLVGPANKATAEVFAEHWKMPKR